MLFICKKWVEEKKKKDTFFFFFYYSSWASTKASPSGINISIFLLQITVVVLTQQGDRMNNCSLFLFFPPVILSCSLNCYKKLLMVLTYSWCWSKARKIISISLKWEHLYEKRKRNITVRLNYLSDIEFVIVMYRSMVSRALSVLGIAKPSSVRQHCTAERTAEVQRDMKAERVARVQVHKPGQSESKREAKSPKCNCIPYLLDCLFSERIHQEQRLANAKTSSTIVKVCTVLEIKVSKNLCVIGASEKQGYSTNFSMLSSP